MLGFTRTQRFHSKFHFHIGLSGLGLSGFQIPHFTFLFGLARPAGNHPLTFGRIGDLLIRLTHFLEKSIGVDDGVILLFPFSLRRLRSALWRP